MTKENPELPADLPEDVAISWFLRRSIAPLTDAEQAEFETWLEESSDHHEAFLEVEQFWAGSAQLAALPKFDDKRRAILRRIDRSAITRRAVLAGVAAVAVMAAAIGVRELEGPRRLADQAFRTAVGQQATVTLPDGSVVTLNTDTVVRTKEDEGRRLVFLDKGQAYFRVAKDRRHPFVVSAAGRTVTALGTAFDVRVDGGALRVVLVEGKVRVEGDAASERASGPKGAPAPAGAAASVRATEMEAGSELIAQSPADWRVTRTDVASATSWTRGKIVFDDESLGDVVAELNRYSERKIAIADPGLAGVRISGVYRPGDIEALAFGLRQTGIAKLERDAGGEARIVALR